MADVLWGAARLPCRYKEYFQPIKAPAFDWLDSSLYDPQYLVDREVPLPMCSW